MTLAKHIRLLLLLTGIVNSMFSQSQKIKFDTEIYDNYLIENDIPYGISVGANDSVQHLLLDVYMGAGDTTKDRPLVIFIHGGGFRNGNKVLKMNTLFCSHFAKSGYVCASINYRLTNAMKSNDEYFAAMVRAVQDAKSAVRFFKRDPQRFKIDTSNIFVMGSSAGAITALHLAYLDQNEIPPAFDMTKVGSLEGNSGNRGYTSTVRAVINCWGALGDVRWIHKGDIPVMNIHGVNDTTIAYDSSFSWKVFKYGSTIIHNRALKEGITSELRLFYNTGHTLDNDPIKHDSAAKDITKWLSKIMHKEWSGL